MKIVLGDICYPKSEAMIIPTNTKGIMTRGVPSRVVKVGLSSICKEVDDYISDKEIELCDCFKTGPGRLNRRGLKKIYHLVIKRLPSDFSSIHIINNALKNAFNQIVEDKVESVALCGLGINEGNLDPKTIARITVENCIKYKDILKISIIDDNPEFIREVNNFVKELNNVIIE